MVRPSAFPECLEMLLVGCFCQGPQVLLGQVPVAHRCRDVCVAHRFLDQGRGVTFGQPGSDPSVA